VAGGSPTLLENKGASVYRLFFVPELLAAFHLSHKNKWFIVSFSATSYRFFKNYRPV
jgi:hypothetical protein